MEKSRAEERNTKTRKVEAFDLDAERKLAKEDLDKTLLLIIDNTTKYLIDNNKMIAVESIETRNKLLNLAKK